MYELLKNVVIGGKYDLNDIANKINTIWISGQITESQRNELLDIARKNAKAENSYADMQLQIRRLQEKIILINDRIEAFENAFRSMETEQAGSDLGDHEISDTDSVDSGQADPDPEEETYPEYVQPLGAHDAYKEGDKCSENGKNYICNMNGCVWPPSVYPAAWDEVTS